MEYTVRMAFFADLSRIEEIYACARRFMAENGNPSQWGNTHPPREQLEEDIREGKLYLVTENNQVHGVFFFAIGPDETYAVINGQWHSQKPYGVIHRIAGDGSGGILAAAMAFSERHTDYIRIDTHHDNLVMQKALQKQGFRQCGIIHTADGSPRIAYDKV